MRNTQIQDLPEVLSAKEVAEFLDISHSHVFNLIDSGKLQAIKNIGRVTRITKTSLLELMGVTIV